MAGEPQLIESAARDIREAAAAIVALMAEPRPADRRWLAVLEAQVRQIARYAPQPMGDRPTFLSGNVVR